MIKITSRRLVGGKYYLAAISAPDFRIASGNLVVSPLLLLLIPLIKKAPEGTLFIIGALCFAIIGLIFMMNISSWSIRLKMR